jgi:hypothetical protein
MTMESSQEMVFQNDLMTGEKIYWSGQPDPSVLFSASDILLIPFSLIWGGFAIFWELSCLGFTGFVKQGQVAPVVFSIFGLPFVGIGLYMIFGRFFFKIWKKKRTFYAVTNRRILIATQTYERQLQAQFLNQIPAINKSISSNGRGSLSFGSGTGLGFNYANSGMDFMGRRGIQAYLGFYDIPQAEAVYQTVSQLQNKAMEAKP